MAAGSALACNSITLSDFPLQVNALAGNATVGNRKRESVAILSYFGISLVSKTARLETSEKAMVMAI